MITRLLTAEGLTRHAERELLWEGVSLDLQAGQRIALTGANGSGKSTLLEILAGSRQPAEGSVTVAPGVDRILVRQADAAFVAGSIWQRAAAALERVLGLEQELRAAERALSGSEGLLRYAELTELFEAAGGYGAEGRLRELLAAFGIRESRWQEPFALLSAGERKRVELAAALAAPPGVLLLDEPDSSLDAGSRALLLAQLRRYAGGVIFSSHDRAFIEEAATHVAGLRRHRLQVTRGGYARHRQLLGLARSNARGWQLEGAARGTLLRLGPLELPLSAAAGTSLRIPELTVEAGDKIVLLGANGSGKSSLLRFIAGSLHASALPAGVRWSDDVRLEHWDQPGRGLAADGSVFSQLERVTSRERASQLLGLLRVPWQAWQRTPAGLSGGERARVAVARLLAVEANLLLLDEPTADLDITAIENLQDALTDTQAAVLLVTHDTTLATALADRVWALEGDTLVEYRGGMDGYSGGRRRREPAAAAVPAPGPGAPPEPAPVTLESAEDELLEIDSRLADPLLLGEREAARLRSRQRELIDVVSQLLDEGYPAPAPRFAVREAGISVGADFSGTTLEFVVDAPCSISLLRHGEVAHLLLREEEGSCLLPWVRIALVNAATRLAFYCLGVRVVQYAQPAALPPAPARLLLAPAGGGWFVLNREDFLRLENWQWSPAGVTMER
jgi:ATPase subunit of ABC transporter with duplicated ATPase domains